MSTPSSRRGRVAVIGAGPAGMATALSVHQAGHDVTLLERYHQARPAGNILNLWPPPIKALALLGVDTTDLGAPCRPSSVGSTAMSALGSTCRARSWTSTAADSSACCAPSYTSGCSPPCRPASCGSTAPSTASSRTRAASGCRMADGRSSRPTCSSGPTASTRSCAGHCGATRRSGSTTCTSSAGFTFDSSVAAERGLCVLTHSRTVQGSWTSIRHKGRDGFQWWVLGAYDAGTEFTGDLHATATRMAARFPAPLPELIAATEPANVQRWVLRDRKPLKQWSKGRATIVGDAAHPTSPYAAYGAGMATEDGYFLGRRLAGVDLSDYGAVVKRSTHSSGHASRTPRSRSSMAYMLGKVFHHAPLPCRWSATSPLTSRRSCRRSSGDASPGEMSSNSWRSTKPSTVSPLCVGSPPDAASTRCARLPVRTAMPIAHRVAELLAFRRS